MRKYFLLIQIFTLNSVLVSIVRTVSDSTSNKDEKYINAQCTVQELLVRTEIRRDTTHEEYATQNEVNDKEQLVWLIREQYQLTCTSQTQNQTDELSSLVIHIRLAIFLLVHAYPRSFFAHSSCLSNQICCLNCHIFYPIRIRSCLRQFTRTSFK